MSGIKAKIISHAKKKKIIIHIQDIQATERDPKMTRDDEIADEGMK